MGTSTSPGPIVTQVAVGEGVGVDVGVSVCVGVGGLVGEGVVMVKVSRGTALVEGVGEKFLGSVASTLAQLDSITARNTKPKIRLDTKWCLHFVMIIGQLLNVAHMHTSVKFGNSVDTSLNHELDIVVLNSVTLAKIE